MAEAEGFGDDPRAELPRPGDLSRQPAEDLRGLPGSEPADLPLDVRIALLQDEDPLASIEDPLHLVFPWEEGVERAPFALADELALPADEIGVGCPRVRRE